MTFYLIALSIFGMDECVKRRAEKHRMDEERTILCDKIILRNHHNRGVCLNMFDRRHSLVTCLSAALTAMIAARIFYLRKDMAQIGYNLGLSLILGGALSNTWDRIYRKYVVDYFSFNCKWKRLQDIVFNLSDLFIFAGFLLAVMGRKD